jgi:hypothetical protein
MSLAVIKTVGRPKRDREFDRVNYKLDSGIRSLFKEFVQTKRLTEGKGVEKSMLQSIAIDRLLNSDKELTYESIEKEIDVIWLELTA